MLAQTFISTAGKYTGLSFKVSANAGDLYEKAGIWFERVGTGTGTLHLINDGVQDSANAILSDAKLSIEQDGVWYTKLGRTPTGSLHGNAVSENTMFDALAPSVPSTNDEVIITGAFWEDPHPSIISRAKRTGANTIDLYIIQDGAVATTTVTNGGASTIAISISW